MSASRLDAYSSLFPIVWPGKLCSFMTSMIVKILVMANITQLALCQTRCSLAYTAVFNSYDNIFCPYFVKKRRLRDVHKFVHSPRASHVLNLGFETISVLCPNSMLITTLSVCCRRVELTKQPSSTWPHDSVKN